MRESRVYQLSVSYPSSLSVADWQLTCLSERSSPASGPKMCESDRSHCGSEEAFDIGSSYGSHGGLRVTFAGV